MEIIADLNAFESRPLKKGLSKTPPSPSRVANGCKSAPNTLQWASEFRQYHSHSPNNPVLETSPITTITNCWRTTPRLGGAPPTHLLKRRLIGKIYWLSHLSNVFLDRAHWKPKLNIGSAPSVSTYGTSAVGRIISRALERAASRAPGSEDRIEHPGSGALKTWGPDWRPVRQFGTFHPGNAPPP